MAGFGRSPQFDYHLQFFSAFDNNQRIDKGLYNKKQEVIANGQLANREVYFGRKSAAHLRSGAMETHSAVTGKQPAGVRRSAHGQKTAAPMVLINKERGGRNIVRKNDALNSGIDKNLSTTAEHVNRSTQNISNNPESASGGKTGPSDDTLFQFSKGTIHGAVHFTAKDTRALVCIFQSADASASLHEITHVIHHFNQKMALRPDASPELRQRYVKQCEYVGAEPCAKTKNKLLSKYRRYTFDVQTKNGRSV